MSDVPMPPRGPHMNNTLSVVLAIIVLIFNATIIVCCLLYGDPANSLHSSGQSWAFFFSGGILIGFGIGSDRVLDILSTMIRR